MRKRDGDWREGTSRWKTPTGLNINVILWETLASIGALDTISAPGADDVFPAETYNYDESTYSDYDGLLYFRINPCLLYTSDAADERSRVNLGGRGCI